MKFYQVNIDSDYFWYPMGRKIFKKKSEAIKLLRELKKDAPIEYGLHVTFDCMEIYIDSDTILNILNGDGYASEIIEMTKP